MWYVAPLGVKWYHAVPMAPSDISVIAALATPPGEGAIAVIRLSGEQALEVADRVFRGSAPLASAAGYTVHYGHIVTSREARVDEVLALVFRAMHSYTGEDAVEFHCHGGILVSQEVLKALFAAGARQAEPGEFTRRAFLNGRIDLSQAEAVADLIAARSSRARAQSLQQLEGKLGRRIGELRGALLDLCSLLELELDFAEEGIDLVGKDEIRGKMEEVDARIRSMVETYEGGRIAREGVLVVLAGRPNAGKSSLFNALLGEDRTIVTSLPGTTRDTVEESIVIDGILFRLVDTAGLRRATDPIEAEGVDRTRHQVRYADIVLLVEDACENVQDEEIENALHGLLEQQKLVLVFNKIDLLRGEEFHPPRVAGGSAHVISVSARTGKGLLELKSLLREIVSKDGIDPSESVVVTNKRHVDALQAARDSLRLALDGIGQSNEFIALDIREAVSRLSEITGEVTTEDVLNSIFSRFCVGK